MQKSNKIIFDNHTQWLIAFFGMFIAFPVFDIPVLEVSVTFPIFLLILYWTSKRVGRIFFINGTLDKIMLSFVLVSGVSIMFAPPPDRGGYNLLIQDIKNYFYLAYWFSVYLFFKQWYSSINLKRLSVFVLSGLLLSSIVILFGGSAKGGFVLGSFNITQNSYAFNTVTCLGISCIYIFYRFKFWALLPVGVFFAYTMLRSESRTGGILIGVQCLMLASVVVAADRIWMRKTLVVFIIGALIVCLFIGVSVDYSKIGGSIASWVEPFNYELAELLRDPESVSEKDKSWLIRKTQVEKGIDLFKKYPIIGIGWGHFKYIRADINIKKYKYLNREYDTYALRKSSHNSYIQILSETGILGIIPFLLIQLFIMKWVGQIFISSESVIEPCLLGVSLFGVSIYFWVISAITGAGWYFILGLFAGTIKEQRKKDEVRFLLPHSCSKGR